MKKVYTKLAASILAVVVSLAMIGGVSYAWLTLSESPAVNGINVTIAGGKTILLAPDVTKTVTTGDGEVTVHYPGAFSDTLNLSRYESYDYLNTLAGLRPVSTADGLYWFIPAYDEGNRLKPVSEFEIDDQLKYANLEKAADGCYIYLDFWIVSPGSEYNIRVAADARSHVGSYLIELPEAQAAEEGFILAETPGLIGATARVGFLVNTETGSTEGMQAYTESPGFDSRYNKLLGQYGEPDAQADREAESRFIIYEPNGTAHPATPAMEGTYAITAPLCYDPLSESITEADIRDRLTVQTASRWSESEGERLLDQQFRTAVIAKTGLTEETATSYFYEDFLQGQVGPYITSGDFYSSTAALYRGGEPSPAGATEDAVITTLQRNTPQRIRMFLWLEGQDADCINTSSVPASLFSLSIELSGETQ